MHASVFRQPARARVEHPHFQASNVSADNERRPLLIGGLCFLKARRTSNSLPTMDIGANA
jgi:hypothetical protein